MHECSHFFLTETAGEPPTYVFFSFFNYMKECYVQQNDIQCFTLTLALALMKNGYRRLSSHQQGETFFLD